MSGGRPLTDDEAARLARLLLARDRVAAADLRLARARVRIRLADAALGGLAADVPRRARVEASLLRRKAEGLLALDRADRAGRYARFHLGRALHAVLGSDG